jgi:hypothetical protein
VVAARASENGQIGKIPCQQGIRCGDRPLHRDVIEHPRGDDARGDEEAGSGLHPLRRTIGDLLHAALAIEPAAPENAPNRRRLRFRVIEGGKKWVAGFQMASGLIRRAPPKS